VMPELDDAAGIAFEDDHHPATDLGGWERHGTGSDR